ncbi:MAG TPA: DUF459 domain-containing protein [Nannocystis exedens]|nr:DUF459 domain-containing protein [Nannocystis exedens]
MHGTNTTLQKKTKRDETKRDKTGQNRALWLTSEVSLGKHPFVYRLPVGIIVALTLCVAACKPGKASEVPGEAPPSAAPDQPSLDTSANANRPPTSDTAKRTDPPTEPEPESESNTVAEIDTVPAPSPPQLGCSLTGQDRFIYGIGSSSMGSLLGPMLGRQVKQRFAAVTFRKWGKSASGLARPDYHDWIAEIPAINSDYDPDVYVVSIGTNDAQPLYSRRYKWVRISDPRWRQLYAERIDKILDLMAGDDRRRRIIWIGPNAFPKGNSRRVGPIIDALLAERIAAFDGDAHYIPLYDKTSPKPGQYIESVNLKGSKKPKRAWTEDHIHLSRFAVRALMIDPVLELLEPCFSPSEDPETTRTEVPTS